MAQEALQNNVIVHFRRESPPALRWVRVLVGVAVPMVCQGVAEAVPSSSAARTGRAVQTEEEDRLSERMREGAFTRLPSRPGHDRETGRRGVVIPFARHGPHGLSQDPAALTRAADRREPRASAERQAPAGWLSGPAVAVVGGLLGCVLGYLLVQSLMVGIAIAFHVWQGVVGWACRTGRDSGSAEAWPKAGALPRAAGPCPARGSLAGVPPAGCVAGYD